MAKNETRYDRYGPIKLMAEVEHYVMVRRPRAMPFVMAATMYRTLPQTTAVALTAAKRATCAALDSPGEPAQGQTLPRSKCGNARRCVQIESVMRLSHLNERTR